MNALGCEAVVRAALGEPLKRGGAELLYRCPHPERHANSDVHPSLKINWRKNVWACFPCNAHGNAWALAAFLARLDPSDKAGVTAWLKEHGLLNCARRSAKQLADRKLVSTHVYSNADGTPVARKLRFEPGREGQKKDFKWQRWENGAWVDGLGGITPPLYRCREIQNEPMVVYVEGEKAADAGAMLGLATSTAGGVNCFRPDHSEALRGKDVVIFPDNDPPGLEHVQRVAAMLHGVAGSILIVELPHLPEKGDLYDYIERGGTREALLELIRNAQEWKPAEGREILDSVLRFVWRFVSHTEGQARVVTLWVAHTHALDASDCTAYLSINSAEKQSGKTRLLEVLETLVREPWLTGRVTAAVLTRKIDAVKPTLLLDESDSAFGSERDYAEALRGILNTGYRRGGKASCCVGQGANITYKDFSTFCPKAIAGIGELPDTVTDRSIPIRLKRARRGEVQKFRKREAEREASDVKARLATWCAANIERMRDARPEIPDQLSDRQADCCEPLLAIADLAGAEWPETARHALVELCCKAQADDQSVGVRLLEDIRAIFTERGVDRISSADLASVLTAVETSPWAEWHHGKPLTASKLARLLGQFEITPGTIRVGPCTPRGYYLRDFQDAFSRYLPTENRHTATSLINRGESNDSNNATAVPRCGSEDRTIPNENASCGVVAVSEARTARKGVEEEL